MYKFPFHDLVRMTEALGGPGGFTYNLDDSKFMSPDKGYAVGGSPHPTGILGGWLENGHVYLDNVDILDSREGAIRLANTRNEKAIYDFAAKESVYVKVAA